MSTVPTPIPTPATSLGCVSQLSRFSTPLLIGAAIIGTHFFDSWTAGPTPVPSAAISLEPTYSAKPNELVQVVAKTNGAQVRWIVHHQNVQQFGGQLADPKEAWFSSATQGQYKISAVTAVSQAAWYKPWTWFSAPIPSNRAETTLTIGDGPPPGPGPIPPGPTPPIPPTPSPAPIPAPGFRVMIVYDNDPQVFSKYPKEQSLIFTSSQIRDYLNANCAKGPDGKTPEWRIWPKSATMVNESDLWKAAFSRPRASLPWLLISNGTTGFEGVLPGTINDAMNTIQKYAPTGAVWFEVIPRQRLPTFLLMPRHEPDYLLGS